MEIRAVGYTKQNLIVINPGVEWAHPSVASQQMRLRSSGRYQTTEACDVNNQSAMKRGYFHALRLDIQHSERAHRAVLLLYGGKAPGIVQDAPGCLPRRA